MAFCCRYFVSLWLFFRKLTWDASVSDDVISYCIYRLDLSTHTPITLTDLSYVDQTIIEGNYIFNICDRGKGITSIDTKFPYSVYWNVSALPNGEYKLRAVAYDENNIPELYPPYITVHIDDVNYDIVEDGNPDVDPNKPSRQDSHTKQEKLKGDSDAEVSLGDGTKALFKAGSFKGEKMLVVRALSSEEISGTVKVDVNYFTVFGLFALTNNKGQKEKWKLAIVR